jgi:Transcriptional regulator, AbiEi antitoxin
VEGRALLRSDSSRLALHRLSAARIASGLARLEKSLYAWIKDSEIACILRRTLSTATQVPAHGQRTAPSPFKKSGGILSTKRAVELGVHPRDLYALRDAGKLERLERGLYRLANAKPLGNPDLLTVSHKVPKGIVCLISALAFHRLRTQIPHVVYLAIPANDQVPALQCPPLQIFWYSKPVYESGVEKVTLDGTPVRIYSAEKRLADCLKYRNKGGCRLFGSSHGVHRPSRFGACDHADRY